MRPARNVSYSVGQPISIPSHDPRTVSSQTTRLQKGPLSEGPKTGIRSLNRMNVDLPMRTFIKIYEF
jgi:hypothetical protein